MFLFRFLLCFSCLLLLFLFFQSSPPRCSRYAPAGRVRRSAARRRSHRRVRSEDSGPNSCWYRTAIATQESPSFKMYCSTSLLFFQIVWYWILKFFPSCSKIAFTLLSLSIAIVLFIFSFPFHWKGAHLDELQILAGYCCDNSYDLFKCFPIGRTLFRDLLTV